MTCTFKASSCKKYDAWKTIDRPMQKFGISYHHLHECSLTMEHLFPNSYCTKVSVDKISHWYCWPLLYSTRVGSSETLAAMVVPDDTIVSYCSHVSSIFHTSSLFITISRVYVVFSTENVAVSAGICKITIAVISEPKT